MPLRRPAAEAFLSKLRENRPSPLRQPPGGGQQAQGWQGPASIPRATLSAQIILALEKERQRLAWDLHDTVAQRVLGAAYSLQALRGTVPKESAHALQKITVSLQETLRELRWAIESLRPPDLEQGLAAALGQYWQSLAGGSPIAFSVEVRGEGHPLPLPLETVAYRIAQETLTNAWKHSGASRVEVKLHYQPRKFSLEIEDNGRGFDLEAVLHQARDRGLRGLVGMMERARSVGGEILVRARPGAGTRITLHLPREE